MATAFFDGLRERVDLQRFLVGPEEFTLTGEMLGMGMSGPVLSCQCRGQEGAAKLFNVSSSPNVRY